MDFGTSDLRCHCGGSLRGAKLKEYDCSGYVGVPFVIREVPGYRCTKCSSCTLDGKVLDTLERVLAIAITRKPFLLSPQEAKFLRKHLGLTQMELAEKMGITRETLARWETGEEISPQNDLILRTVVVATLRSAPGQSGRRVTPAQVLNETIMTLASVRRQPSAPGTTLDPSLVQSLLEKLRPAGSRHSGGRSR